MEGRIYICENCFILYASLGCCEASGGIYFSEYCFIILYASHCSIKCLILCLILFQVDASTNTDPDAYFDNKIGDIEKNIDDIFNVVNKRKSVVNDARKQIDELRLNTLKRTLTTACTNKSNAPTQADSMQIQNTTMNNSSGEQTTWAWRLFHPEPLSPLNQDARSMPNQVADLTDVDPAIVSVRTTRTNSLMNGSCWTMSML